MINAPIGGPDILTIQNISPAVLKSQQDTGSDFKQAFESAKETVSGNTDSTKVKRTDGTGAGGKDSGAADQTVIDSKKEQNIHEAAGGSKDTADRNDAVDSTKTDAAEKNVSAARAEAEGDAEYDTAEISRIAEKLILDIAALLGITPEELTGFLEDMGIEAADLCISDNINILVADVRGGGDMISLAADADLLKLAGAINSAVAEAEEKLSALTEGMPEEDIRDIFAESLEKSAIPAPEAGKDDAAALSDAAQGNADTEGIPAMTDMTAQKADTPDNGENASAGNTDEEDERPGLRDGRELHENMAIGHGETAREAEVRPDELIRADESLMKYGTNAAEVAEQIMEHMKGQIKVDMGSLEMVLHPASLGNVAVNIANTANGLTAQFAVQNEAVKEAIEAQIVIFKENLEQQGVKVEAVEVSVASHGFEENLEQGNEQNDAEDDERERLRKATRNIDLGDSGEEIPEDIDEAEAVTVDMMRSDGNRMNYRI